MTGTIDDSITLKAKALDLYVTLKTKPVEKTAEDVMILPVPHTTYNIHIKPEDYQIIKDLSREGKVLQAIKHLRCSGLINGDKDSGGLGLKEAKDFVDNHPWR